MDWRKTCCFAWVMSTFEDPHESSIQWRNQCLSCWKNIHSKRTSQSSCLWTINLQIFRINWQTCRRISSHCTWFNNSQPKIQRNVDKIWFNDFGRLLEAKHKISISERFYIKLFITHRVYQRRCEQHAWSIGKARKIKRYRYLERVLGNIRAWSFLPYWRHRSNCN